MPGHYGREAVIREALAEAIGASRYDLWFGEGVRVGVDAEEAVLEIGVPNSFFRDWLLKHYSEQFREVTCKVIGRSLPLVFHLSDAAGPISNSASSATPASSARSQSPAQASPSVSSAPAASGTASGAARQSARPLRRLDDFIVGPSNRLAHAAATEAAESLGRTFNPLLIHGDIGLGKTHLLEGISASIRARRPDLRIVHLTAETFANRFIDALRNNGLAGFRSKHRATDLFIVDDIHFLAAKRATQDEFLHTFNALIQDGAAIVMAADQHPKLIAKLTDELATRFVAGMVVKITPPDFATRKDILKTKALMRGIDVPDPVISFVAEHLRSSVRELEGALNSLIAHAALTGKRLDLALAKIALRDTIRHESQAIALQDVERAVVRLFRVDPSALKSDQRSRSVSCPRMFAMYLSRKRTGAPYSEIGRYFGGRNHTTVIAAEKRVESWLKQKRSVPIPGFESAADALSALEHALGV